MLVKNKKTGFTIVELLVVIVVIGILATITIVTYIGISQKAVVASLKSDLTSSAGKLKLYYIENDKYPGDMSSTPPTYCPTDPDDPRYCIKASPNTTFDYSPTGTNDSGFTLIATQGDLSYSITEDGVPTEVAGGGSGSSFAMAWGGEQDDYGVFIVQTSDGGYAVTGPTSSFGTGDSDVFLAKYDSSGALSWNKTWGGDGEDYGYSLIQTSDDGYAVTGETSSFGAGGSDLFVAKFNSSGALSWNKTWGDSDYDAGSSIVQTGDGGYAVTGYTTSGDMLLVKYDSSGNLTWNKTWGGDGGDHGESVVITSDGGFIVTGSTASPDAPYFSDIFIAKYTSDGTLSWVRTWGSEYDEYSHSIIQTSDGGYAITGETYGFGAEYIDMFIAKFDSSGTLSWGNTWANSEAVGGYASGRSIVQLSDDSYVIAGTSNDFTSSRITLVKYSSIGALSWSKSWGGEEDEEGFSMAQSSDGGFVVTGETLGYGAGGFDMVLVKFKSDGTITGCSSPTCLDISATVTNQTTLVATPSGTITTPSATITTPSATVNTPSATVTTIISP